MKPLWQNIIFKFGFVLATVVILGSIELYLHYKTTKSLKEATVLLSFSKTSIENLLEADRDIYQSNLAIISSIHEKERNKNSLIDSLENAAYENLSQIEGRYNKFNYNYKYRKSAEFEHWKSVFDHNYSELKKHTDSLYFFIHQDNLSEAQRYYGIYLNHFYKARLAIDKATDIHYLESDHYLAKIKHFNQMLSYRSFFLYIALILIFFMVSYLSIKSIVRRTREIDKLNRQLEIKNREIIGVNENLVDANARLGVVNEELLTSNEELNTLNETLADQKKYLEDTIEQLKKAQLQLIQSEKNAAVGIMVAGLAHEINNPLNFINSGLQAFEKIHKTFLHTLQEFSDCNNLEELKEIKTKFEKEKAELTEAKFDKLLSGILNGSHRIGELCKNISLHHQGKEINEVQDLGKIVDFCIELEINTPGKSIAFVKKYGNVPPICCNFRNLCQTINIITKNAIDAIDKTGSISFATGSNDDEIYISISDTGTGIPENIIDKIFDPFFTTKPVGKGAGIGLYLAYDMVKKAGGTIIVDSEMGKGSTFTIFLPKNIGNNNNSKIINNHYTF